MQVADVRAALEAQKDPHSASDLARHGGLATDGPLAVEEHAVARVHPISPGQTTVHHRL